MPTPPAVVSEALNTRRNSKVPTPKDRGEYAPATTSKRIHPTGSN